MENVALPSLRWMLPAGFGPPLLVFLGQWGGYADWKPRMRYFPVQVFLSVGIALNNTLAVLAALAQRPTPFARTPKFNLESQPDYRKRKMYAIPLNWTVAGELILAGYAFITMFLAFERLPGLVPPLAIITLGFGFVGGMGLWERVAQRVRVFRARSEIARS
jgi:hypothetical protein